jgi:carbamoyl-phosphate synthase large subunit
MTNVLIFPAGTEVGLEIYHSLKYSRGINIYAAGDDSENHAQLIYKQYWVVPNASDASCLARLCQLCKTLKIDYLFPAHDRAIDLLSSKRTSVPCTVILPNSEAVTITRSKRLTYETLKDIVRVPTVYEPNQVDDYPVFIKPDDGHGAINSFKINNKEELAMAVKAVNNQLICEYIKGSEITIDCFSDSKRGLLFAGARKRLRIRNGISVRSIEIENKELMDLASNISSRLRLRGAWFFQVIVDERGEFVLLEVGTRIAGSMSLHRVKGINMPILAIYERQGRELLIKKREGTISVDRALYNQYLYDINFSSLYIDLDDTIIVNNKLNILAIQLIYQCIQKGIKIVLVTRRQEKLEETLQRYKIKHLFDEVNQLQEWERKSTYIRDKNSIFVDDSFRERIDVETQAKVPTYDCSMIECIVNNKMFFSQH